MYALLIGINHYLPNRLPNGLYYKSLWGCAQDILRIEEFLRQKLELPAEHIIKLTSSNGQGEEPLEPPEQWPTYKNIVEAFGKLEEMAQPDDQVYIHYSGHGGRTATTAEFQVPDLKGPEGIDEVLVPMDLGDSEGRYLRDTELQHLLKRLVDKKLLVTIVLDSCHAGGATRAVLVDPKRSGTGVRGISRIDGTPAFSEIDYTRRPSASLVASPEELVKTWITLSNGGTRSAKFSSGWLLEPKGYVLLAACRACEYANEYPFEGNGKNGALSYWLLDSLKQIGPGFTYKMLHDRILAKVHGQFPDQTPQLQGEGNRIVFGRDEVLRQHAVTVIKVDSPDQIVLNAGQAQEVGPGSKFNVFALYETDFTKTDARIATVEVIDSGATSSIARILSSFSRMAIEPGCQAVLFDRGSNRLRRHVSFAIPDKAASDGVVNAITEVERILADNPNGFIQLATGKAPSDYLVTISEGKFVICDAGGLEIESLNFDLNVTDPQTTTRLIERLVHLAKYCNVRELDNDQTQSPLVGKLLVELTGVQSDYMRGDRARPRPFDKFSGHVPSVQNGETAFLRVRNNSAGVLNITVLDLQPDWGVSQIYPARAADFEPLDPGNELTLPLGARLPIGYEKGTDVIKVFATVETTSFRWLELPPVNGSELSPLNEPQNTRRSALQKLLSALAPEESITRQVEVLASPELEWATRQVEIEVRA